MPPGQDPESKVQGGRFWPHQAIPVIDMRNCDTMATIKIKMLIQRMLSLKRTPQGATLKLILIGI